MPQNSHWLWNKPFQNSQKCVRDLVSEIRGGLFSIICDEYTDISNKEQLIIRIRWVDKELEAHEDFLGVYNVPNIGAETIVSAIKDVLLKPQLSLVHCKGRCYDGASNMMGHKTGVAKKIQDLQPKAYKMSASNASGSGRFGSYYVRTCFEVIISFTLRNASLHCFVPFHLWFFSKSWFRGWTTRCQVRQDPVVITD